MNRIINAILAVLILYGSGHITKEAVIGIEKIVFKRIKKGLSKSEPFAQKLTGTKLNF